MNMVKNRVAKSAKIAKIALVVTLALAPAAGSAATVSMPLDFNLPGWVARLAADRTADVGEKCAIGRCGQAAGLAPATGTAAGRPGVPAPLQAAVGRERVFGASGPWFRAMTLPGTGGFAAPVLAALPVTDLAPTVETDVDEISAIAPVPLPAAGFLLLAGIGGIVALRRRGEASAPVA